MTTYYKNIHTHVEYTANCYVVRAEGENRIGEVRFQVRVVDKKRVEQHEQGPVEIVDVASRPIVRLLMASTVVQRVATEAREVYRPKAPCETLDTRTDASNPSRTVVTKNNLRAQRG